MWRALQADEPSDFVLATGQSTSLKQFLDYAFGAVGLDWRNHVEVDQRFLRPSESGSLVGNPQKARDVLGWTAETPAWKLAQIMVEADLATLKLRQNPGMVTSASRP
jgi:GDPmannose 4,6-dehydratase